MSLIEDQAVALSILFVGRQNYVLRWKDIEELFSALGVEQNKTASLTVAARFNSVSAEFEIPRIGEPVSRELAMSVRRFLVEAGKDLEF